jgi:membrane protein DedA with SNARE-associated domain
MPKWLNFFLPDKATVILWVPLFALAMWYGIAQHFEDIGLYTAAMALGTLGIASRTIHLRRKWQEWRGSKERNRA